MKLETCNTFCASLPSTTNVVQWGGAHVWKVGGKVFAIAGWSDSEDPHIVFKTSDLAFDILKEQPGLRPAPYLTARGGKWIQLFEPDAMMDDDLFSYLAESHRLISLKLPRKVRAELRLGEFS